MAFHTENRSYATELSGDFTADAPIYEPGPPGSTPTQFSCNGVLDKICPGFFDKTANYMANTVGYWPLPNKVVGGVTTMSTTPHQVQTTINSTKEWTGLLVQNRLFADTRAGINQDPTPILLRYRRTHFAPGFQGKV